MANIITGLLFAVAGLGLALFTLRIIDRGRRPHEHWCRQCTGFAVTMLLLVSSIVAAFGVALLVTR